MWTYLTTPFFMAVPGFGPDLQPVRDLLMVAIDLGDIEFS
jgi:hypothetical protein